LPNRVASVVAAALFFVHGGWDVPDVAHLKRKGCDVTKFQSAF